MTEALLATRSPGRTRFTVDRGEYLRQHDVTFRRPPLRAADCLAIGNGDVGLQVDASGSQLFFGYVMKTDVWDRGDESIDPIGWHVPFADVLAAKGDQRRMGELEATERLRRYGGDPNERRVMPKPLGRIQLTVAEGGTTLKSSGEVRDLEQRLSLYDATVETSYGWRANHRTKIRTFVHSASNLIVFDVRDTSLVPHERKALLSRGPDPRLPTRPTTGSGGGRFWIRYEFPGGFAYVMVGAILGVDAPVGHEEGRAYADLVSSGETAFRLHVAVASTTDASDPMEKALEILSTAERTGAAENWASHRTWWHTFWDRSFISISDKEVENVWYLHNYALARASRGPLASWLLWAEEENDLAWNGAFWDISVNNYLGCFGANHVDLADPFFRLQIDCLPAARRNAKELYGRAGARFAHAYGPDGLEVGVLWPRLMHFAGAYVSMLFWWRYLYTRDRTFLGRAYPVLREAAAFYLDWLERDPVTGRLSMPPPTCPFNEVLWPKSFEVRNNPLELGLVRRLFESVAAASDELSVDAADRGRWRRAMAAMAEMPSDGRTFLEYEGEAPGENALWTVDAVGCIYPALAVDRDDPRCAATVEDNLRRIKYPAGGTIRFDGAAAAFKGLGDLTEERLQTPQLMCCPLLAACAAWVGRPDLFEESIGLHFRHHLLPNGLFGEGATPSPYTPGTLLPAFALSESGGDLVGAINESLLRSLYDGVIVPFAGTPDSWDARFADLRAVGAFLVSAERVRGDVRYVSVLAEAGGSCRIRVPSGWARNSLRARDLTSGETIAEFAPGCVIASFPTDADRSYVLERTGLPFDGFPVTSLMPTPSPRRYIGL